MYYIDTPTQKVVAYEYDDQTGKLGGSRVAVDFRDLNTEGSPDGMTIDEEGMLWVALCHGGAVVQVNPETGELLQKVELPCVETTACAFGGSNLDRLFVTTGIHKTLHEKEAGKVFVIDGLGVSGSSCLTIWRLIKSHKSIRSGHRLIYQIGLIYQIPQSKPVCI